MWNKILYLDRELFQYILIENLTNEQIDVKIEQLERIAEQRHVNNLQETRSHKNKVYNSSLPINLKEIKQRMKFNLKRNPILKLTIKQVKNKAIENNWKRPYKKNKNISDKKIRRTVNKYEKKK